MKLHSIVLVVKLIKEEKDQTQSAYFVSSTIKRSTGTHTNCWRTFPESGMNKFYNFMHTQTYPVCYIKYIALQQNVKDAKYIIGTKVSLTIDALNLHDFVFIPETHQRGLKVDRHPTGRSSIEPCCRTDIGTGLYGQ